MGKASKEVNKAIDSLKTYTKEESVFERAKDSLEASIREHEEALKINKVFLAEVKRQLLKNGS